MKDLTCGPLNKSVSTQLLELVVKCILHAPNKVDFYINNRGDYVTLNVKMGGMDINVSALLKKANLTHIELSEKDSQKYFQICKPNALVRLFNWVINSIFSRGLTMAEKVAIYNYTEYSATNINRFLRDAPSIHDAKETLLLSTFLASGMNKLKPPIGKNAASFRGERLVINSEIELRKDLINKNGGLSKEHAFLSTSSDPEIAKYFIGVSKVTFDCLYGKSISELSRHSYESEFLLSPTCIQWTEHKMEGSVNHFKGKVVNPLIEGIDEPTKEEIETFKQLKIWASKQGVDLQFITPFVNSLLALQNYEPNPIAQEIEIPVTSHKVLTPNKSNPNAKKPDIAIVKTNFDLPSFTLATKPFIIALLSFMAASAAFIYAIYAIGCGIFPIVGVLSLGKILFHSKAKAYAYKNNIDQKTAECNSLVTEFKKLFIPENNNPLSDIQLADKKFITAFENISQKAPLLKFGTFGNELSENKKMQNMDKLSVLEWECERINNMIALKDSSDMRVKQEEDFTLFAVGKFAS